MNTKFRDKPAAYPARGADGKPLKPLPQVLLDRRATAHFKPDSVPEEYLEAILRFGTQAPSGYNLQPWRFLVVREKENRQRLKTAAFGQQKIAEAPVVIIAYAIQNDWRNYFDDILEEGVRRGCTSRDTLPELKQQAANFLEKQISQSVWLNRQTMIAVTSMMLLAGAFGLDTAPMEGFDPLAIGRAFGLPENAEVIALLAVGFARDPEKPYGGRLDLSEIVHDEHFGRPWVGHGDDNAHDSSRRMFDQIRRQANEPYLPAPME